MFIKSFAAGPWQTNCYIIAPNSGSECIIIDPGMKAASGIRDVIREHNLRPVAAMLTHGHIDHMWSIFPVAQGYGIPAFVHGSDRHLISDPSLAMSVETQNALASMMDSDDVFAEPEDLREVTDNLQIELAGLEFKVRHAPGHTKGSVLFDFKQDVPHVFTGDVLFAGAIGRTDLPGGSAQEMNESLRDVVLKLEDSSLVFPGHGPSSSMDIERATNQYLLRVADGKSAV
jgi:glyoxylase-like metal-dependent hydrolase (beta-lactamase superfamily II)